jgi:hypothetical protein
MESCYPATEKYDQKYNKSCKYLLLSSSVQKLMHISIIHIKCFNAIKGIQATQFTVYYNSPEKQQSIIQEGR